MSNCGYCDNGGETIFHPHASESVFEAFMKTESEPYEPTFTQSQVDALLLAHTEAIAKAVEEVKIREDFTPFDDKQRNEVEIYNRGVSDSLQAMAELSEMCAKRARGEASE